MNRVINATWFNTNRSTIGLVAYENDIGEIKFTLGIGGGL